MIKAFCEPVTVEELIRILHLLMIDHFGAVGRTDHILELETEHLKVAVTVLDTSKPSAK